MERNLCEEIEKSLRHGLPNVVANPIRAARIGH